MTDPLGNAIAGERTMVGPKSCPIRQGVARERSATNVSRVPQDASSGASAGPVPPLLLIRIAAAHRLIPSAVFLVRISRRHIRFRRPLQ